MYVLRKLQLNDCLKEAGQVICYDGKAKYSNYGIMILKKDIYLLGGRPAIYSDPQHYELLPNEMKYRFVRFEPLKELRTGDGVIDFTWEREWRMTGDLNLNLLDRYKIIVPSLEIGNKLKNDAEEESFKLFEECQNHNIPIIPFEDIRNDECEVHNEDCAQPIFVEEDCIVCMDNSC